jgi:hypothetical protein
MGFLHASCTNPPPGWVCVTIENPPMTPVEWVMVGAAGLFGLLLIAIAVNMNGDR